MDSQQDTECQQAIGPQITERGKVGKIRKNLRLTTQISLTSTNNNLVEDIKPMVCLQLMLVSVFSPAFSWHPRKNG